MSKTLTAYFSASGTTARTAKNLAQAAGADLYEIRPAVPYTQGDLNWMDKKSRSSVEMNDRSFRPELADKDADIAAYDRILLGFPIWWYVAPTIINTFLESYDFTGKDVYTFSTGASSSGNAAFNALAREYTSINIIENLHFTGRNLANAQTLVSEWIAGLGLAA